MNRRILAGLVAVGGAVLLLWLGGLMPFGSERDTTDSAQRELAPASYGFANRARDQGETASAIELYAKAIAEDPTFAPAYRELAAIRLEQKSYRQALDLLLKLEELTPEDVAVHYTVAQLYVAADRPDLAREALERGKPYLNELEAIQAYEELLQKLQ